MWSQGLSNRADKGSPQQYGVLVASLTLYLLLIFTSILDIWKPLAVRILYACKSVAQLPSEGVYLKRLTFKTIFKRKKSTETEPKWIIREREGIIFVLSDPLPLEKGNYALVSGGLTLNFSRDGSEIVIENSRQFCLLLTSGLKESTATASNLLNQFLNKLGPIPKAEVRNLKHLLNTLTRALGMPTWEDSFGKLSHFQLAAILLLMLGSLNVTLVVESDYFDHMLPTEAELIFSMAEMVCRSRPELRMIVLGNLKSQFLQEYALGADFEKCLDEMGVDAIARFVIKLDGLRGAQATREEIAGCVDLIPHITGPIATVLSI